MKNRFVFGRWETGGPLTAADAARIGRAAREAAASFADYPLDKTLALLGRTGKVWAGSRQRRKAEKVLPGITGFSVEMVRKGLDELCWTLDPELLRRKIDTELKPGDSQRLRWEPLGVVLHVLSGNVFVGAAGALVEGLITRNASILKMPSADTWFLPELLRTLADQDADGAVSRSIAAVEYGSGQADVIAALKSSADGVAVWGGEESVRAYRDGLPAGTRLIVFGPKLSAAVVTKECLDETDLKTVAENLARDVSVWDQLACTAPQACYVEGDEGARALVESLPRALVAEGRRLPPGAPGRDSAVEIQKLRGIFEVAEARGEGLLKASPRGLAWTVVLDRDPFLEPSPLHRTLRVIPLARIADAARHLSPLRGYLQTVGVAASDRERPALTSLLARTGALRIVPLGSMAEGEIDDPHDGRYDLPLYMNLVVARPSKGAAAATTLRLPAGERKALVEARLRRLIETARRSRFYGRRLKGIDVETAGDLRRVPILTRAEMEANMPPQGEGLSTGPWSGGYVSRSGGSTGEPKFSVYDGRDWDAMIASAADMFRDMGFDGTDRLGNFMLAGDLYGSFVSFDHINARLGMASFAFAGTSTPETFVRVWRDFRLTAVQGIPSSLVPFLRKAKALEPKLAITKVMYAGTPLTPADRDWLARELKAGLIVSVIGANDGGQIAYQCPALGGALHHAFDEFNYLELVDDRGRPVPDGEPGRLLITSLLKFAFPLIRYELGDSARFVPGPCPCGGSARVLEYLGRSDDTLCVGLMNVRYRDLERALEGFPLCALQLAAVNDAAGESLVVRAETAAPDGGGLAGRLRAAVLRGMKKVGERLASGDLAELRIEVRKPGELKRNPRTSKVKALVDERK